jgi:hypothetical protein
MRKRSLALAAGLYCTLTLMFIGCGDGRAERVPVTGTVVYRGQPVAGAEVMFMSKSGRPARAITDERGRFELSSYATGDGAILGEHTVLVVKKVEANPGRTKNPYAPTRDVLPVRYGSPKDSGLTANVEKGAENDFAFELKD